MQKKTFSSLTKDNKPSKNSERNAEGKDRVKQGRY